MFVLLGPKSILHQVMMVKAHLSRGEDPRVLLCSCVTRKVSNDAAASNERNIIALKKEMEREKPRKDVVLSLLNETFQARREEILFAGDISFADMLSTHTGLTLL